MGLLEFAFLIVGHIPETETITPLPLRATNSILHYVTNLPL
jgi:hypothetical protein